MRVAMDELRDERGRMSLAECKIRKALVSESPGAATSDILNCYTNLSSEADRTAFVAVLAARVAVQAKTTTN